jgi:hypothetical protein
VVTNHNSTFQAYNIAGTYDALLSGNFSEGGNTGFYADTLSMTNLTVIDNTFRNAWNGVVISLSCPPGYNWDGVAVRNNTIELSPNIPTDQYGYNYGIAIGNNDSSGTVFNRNLVIAGNTIRMYENEANTSQTKGIETITFSSSPDNLVGVRILNNTVDPTMAFSNFKALHTWLADSMDLDGVPHHFRQETVASPGNMTLTPADGSVIILPGGSATTAVTLPTAKGFGAKEILICNRKSNDHDTASLYNTTVSPASGDTITAPTSPLNVPAGQTAKLISDGSSVWVLEYVSNISLPLE